MKVQTILFVDDNELLCRLSCDILRREGYRAIPAFSGAEALEVIDRHAFDLVVSDFQMEGMNGLELATRLHAIHPDLPIIIVSVYDEVASKHIRSWLPKERLFPTLVEEIRACLAEPETAGSAAGPHRGHST